MSTTRLNKDLFKGSMTMIATQFGYDLKDPKLKLYWNRFKETMDDKQFLDSVSQIMDTFVPSSQKPFPLFTHFLGAVGHQAGNVQAKKAVNAVKIAVRRFGRYNSVNFGDSKIHQTIRYYGGWIEICNWTDDVWAMREKNFIDTYNSMSPQPTFTHLVGIHETNNEGRYNVEPPKLVYEHMKEKPIERLEYNARVKVLPNVETINALVNGMSLSDNELPF